MQINGDNGDEVKEMDRFGNDVSGGSRGGAQGAHLPPPPLCLDQTEARGAEKNFFEALISGSGWPGPLCIWRFGAAIGRYRDLRSTAKREWKTSQRKTVGNLEKDNISKKLKESNFLWVLMAWSDQGLICR